MLLFTYLVVILDSVLTVADGSTTCTNPRIRRSWNVLSKEEKLQYTAAVKCLFETRAQGTAYFPAAQTRFDDFASLHINQTSPRDAKNITGNGGFTGPGIHLNSVFLPWHRYFMWIYENTLRDECGYKAAHPYWDWSVDTSEYGSSLPKSQLFDSVYGFGGGGKAKAPRENLGSTPGHKVSVLNCVDDGPFAGLNITFGPGPNLDQPTPRCLNRGFNVSLFDASAQWQKNAVPLLQETDYFTFTHKMSYPLTGAPFGVHGAGHFGVGGEMINLWSSANDPMFFMHHAQVDHMWSMWQGMSEANAKAFNGPISPNGTGLSTLDSPLYMTPFLAPDLPVKAVMDTENKDGSGILCYKYEDNPAEKIPAYEGPENARI
ncbi:Di-copper centre-containing protein [Tothia fuscella]|uniref:Di-copper centre-containing protein n=1 Tax=Tothia fuscella TaxID=1048955 RepID=A0A9P4U368_9PEZI|nr:Di-copper centre-containing protein [Tothia fuscella]